MNESDQKNFANHCRILAEAAKEGKGPRLGTIIRLLEGAPDHVHAITAEDTATLGAMLEIAGAAPALLARVEALERQLAAAGHAKPPKPAKAEK